MISDPTSLSWREAWAKPSFRKYLLPGIGLALLMLALLPPFFQFIEARPGIALHDPVLKYFTPRNLSIPIFACIWSIALLGVFRALRSPSFLLVFAWGFALLTASRMITIYLTGLDTPPGLIPLADPLANRFYGEKFITKDLFYSGHTATVFLFFCCFRGRLERILAVGAASAVGIMVLIQHIHYTIDVLAAPPLTWLCYRTAKKIVSGCC
jgi:hypothetical protein